MANTNNTIVLKGDLSDKHEEAPANAALYPGHMLKMNSSGEVLKNTYTTGNIQIWVAKEDALQGKTVTDAYAAADIVPYHVAEKGDLLKLRVAAAATAIVKGDRIEVATAGLVAKFSAGVVIGIAEEAVDNSGGGSEAFVSVRIV